MVASPGNPDTKPFGLHRMWITPYTDTDGTILADTSYRMPIARTLAFSETEDTETLDGDDKAAVAIQGRGSTIDGSLEAGGLDMMCMSIITGAQLIESGVEPNVKRVLRKKGSDQRPYWRVEGQAISNGGGDNVARIFRCKANGSVSFDMSYGTFMIPSVDFLGTPMPGDDDDYLYEIEFNQQRTTLAATPVPNPYPIPSNVSVGTLTTTTAAISWNDIAQADSFKLQKASTVNGTYSAIASGQGGEPSTNSTTVTSLTAGGTVWVKVAGVYNGVTGPYSSPVQVTTPAS